jgi:hypothetical protein
MLGIAKQIQDIMDLKETLKWRITK